MLQMQLQCIKVGPLLSQREDGARSPSLRPVLALPSAIPLIAADSSPFAVNSAHGRQAHREQKPQYTFYIILFAM